MLDEETKIAGMIGTWDAKKKKRLKSLPTHKQDYKARKAQQKWYRQHAAEKRAKVRRRRALLKSHNVMNNEDTVKKDVIFGKRPKIFNLKGRHYDKFRQTGLGLRNKGDINRDYK